jgi:activator of HSP90 ATPase
MKKITILFITAIISLAVGCSEDGNQETLTETSNNSQLIGRWQLQSWRIGSQTQSLSECQSHHSYWEFFNDFDVTEHFGEIINNNCVEKVYNYRYAINSNEFLIVEQNARVPYQAKYKITEFTPNMFSIRLFWTSQETPSGGVDERVIPENEQPSYTYIKL